VIERMSFFKREGATVRFLRRVLAVFIILVVIGAGTATAVAWNAGWRIYVVRTGSMAPSIRPGDVVIDVPAKNIRLGEVITFPRVVGSYTTHRVVAVTSRGIETKGDANPSPDYGYVTPSEVAGREVAVVPKAGYVLEFPSHPEGLASLALFLLAAWFAWGLLTPARDRRSAKGRHAVRPKHQAGANEPVISLRERDLPPRHQAQGRSVAVRLATAMAGQLGGTPVN
jgi:signal peptidase